MQASANSGQPVQSTGDGVRIRLRIQPRASRDEVAGLHGDSIRIRLRTPPVDGAANQALLRFLSDTLAVPRAALRLISGRSSRSKVVGISGMAVGEVTRRLGL